MRMTTGPGAGSGRCEEELICRNALHNACYAVASLIGKRLDTAHCARVEPKGTARDHRLASCVITDRATGNWKVAGFPQELQIRDYFCVRTILEQRTL